MYLQALHGTLTSPRCDSAIEDHQQMQLI
jgi:hypothetical protein